MKNYEFKTNTIVSQQCQIKSPYMWCNELESSLGNVVVLTGNSCYLVDLTRKEMSNVSSLQMDTPNKLDITKFDQGRYCVLCWNSNHQEYWQIDLNKLGSNCVTSNASNQNAIDRSTIIKTHK